MMTLWEIILISVALAMDCFTVSVVSGIILRRFKWDGSLRMAFLFGFFQAFMPLVGWLAIHYLEKSVEAYDHWIAFGMLFLIGAKMIVDAFSEKEESAFNPLRLRTQLALAVATSIDALAVGISLSCSGYEDLPQLTAPLVIIGSISFIFSILGTVLGVRFGDVVTRRIRPELLGGIILIIIGIKILLEHLLA